MVRRTAAPYVSIGPTSLLVVVVTDTVTTGLHRRGNLCRDWRGGDRRDGGRVSVLRTGAPVQLPGVRCWHQEEASPAAGQHQAYSAQCRCDDARRNHHVSQRRQQSAAVENVEAVTSELIPELSSSTYCTGSHSVSCHTT